MFGITGDNDRTMGATIAKTGFTVEAEVSEAKRIVVTALAARVQNGLDLLPVQIKRGLGIECQNENKREPEGGRERIPEQLSSRCETLSKAEHGVNAKFSLST